MASIFPFNIVITVQQTIIEILANYCMILENRIFMS